MTVSHTNFLRQEVLPKQLVTYGCGIFRPFHLLCVGCEANTILDYVELLESFSEAIPRFRYHLLVSDCVSQRIEETQALVEMNGKNMLTCGRIDFNLEFLEMWNVVGRKNQDVIVCGMKLSKLTCGTPGPVLADICRLLFPGRYLMGQEDLLALDSELPLLKVEKSIFQRTG